jgi:arylsulfatase A-like enzyme
MPVGTGCPCRALGKRRLTATLLSLVLLAGCRGALESPPIDLSALLADPEVVGADHGSPVGLLGNFHGSILFDRGWSPPSPSRSRGNEHLRWALDGQSLFFFPPPVGPSSLLMRCQALSWDGAPQQTMTVTLNGQRIWDGNVKGSFERLTIPIPSAVVVRGLNAVQLDFGYAQRPVDVGINQDGRRLSVLFTELAVVPRGIEKPDQIRVGEGFLPATDGSFEIRLPLGRAITIPIPAASRLSLSLGAINGCDDCRYEVEVLTRNLDARVVGRGAAAAAAGSVIRFSTPGGAPAQLRLKVVDDLASASDPATLVTVNLPAGFLKRESREARAKRAERPSIFIYLVDTLRADAVGTSLAGIETTPNIDAFARDAVRYSRAWAPSTWTLPSVVSMLTGVYPSLHGIMQGGTKLSADNVPGLAGILSQHGYHSVGISQSFISSSRFGLDVGFDDFYLDNYLNSRELGSPRVRRALVEWLLHEYDAEKSIFGFIHTVDPHAPYSTEQLTTRRFAPLFPGSLPDGDYSPMAFMLGGYRDRPEEVARLRARYQDEVLFTDRNFGMFVALLKALDLYDNSVVLLVSDHGEEFAEHGGFDHGRTVFEELVRVPLYVKYPGSRWGGSVVDDRVSGVDLAPTLLELAGIDTSGLSFDGASLVASDDGTAAPPRDTAYSEVNPVASEHRAEVDLKTAVVGDIKCIFSGNRINQFHEEIPEWRVFDLAADAGELTELPLDSAAARQCMELVRRLSRAEDDRRPPPSEAIDEVDREKLRALGYIE